MRGGEFELAYLKSPGEESASSRARESSGEGRLRIKAEWDRMADFRQVFDERPPLLEIGGRKRDGQVGFGRGKPTASLELALRSFERRLSQVETELTVECGRATSNAGGRNQVYGRAFWQAWN